MPEKEMVRPTEGAEIRWVEFFRRIFVKWDQMMNVYWIEQSSFRAAYYAVRVGEMIRFLNLRPVRGADRTECTISEKR